MMLKHVHSKTRLVTLLVACAILNLLSPVGGPVRAIASVRLEEMRSPQFEPLASQCGFHAIYLVLKSSGRDASLSELISDFVGKEDVETNGLSIGEVCSILKKHGMRCEAGNISLDSFRKLPWTRYCMIVLVKGTRSHFEAVLDGKADQVLLGMHGKKQAKWLERDVLWGEMIGPAIIIDKSGSGAIPRAYPFIILGLVLVLLPIGRILYVRYRGTGRHRARVACPCTRAPELCR